MQTKVLGSTRWLEFDVLSGLPGLRHGSFLRHGGTSNAPFTSLNLGMGTTYPDPSAQLNLQKVAGILGAPHVHWAKQCHGGEIAQIVNPTALIPQCDALVTNVPGIALMIQHADCQAALIYDPRRRVIAAVHAGWRGSVLNIYAKVIDYLCTHFQSKPADLLVGISPSLGPQHAQFLNYRVELPKAFWDYQVSPDYFDFWQISRQQLETCGIPSHQIETANICTYANHEDCYSYRREKLTGRHGSLIMLN